MKCCPIAVRNKYVKIWIYLIILNNYLPNRFALMSTEIVSYSAGKSDPSKADRKPRDLGSHSSRSDVYVSASKSNKAFEDSLRKADSINQRREKSNSPFNKKLIFGKYDQEKAIDSKSIYIVDITKKIKRVESPFSKNGSAC